LRSGTPLRSLLLSAAAFHFALSAATAQPTSTATQSASLDQGSNISEINRKKIAKPLVHLEVISTPETVVVLPVVALQLLLTSLIGGATSESGIASVYAGGMTASGTRTVTGGMTAAHRSIPFGTRVQVTNRANGKSVVVRINDRGPFIRRRIIDLMPAAARKLGFSGLTPVTLVVIGRTENNRATAVPIGEIAR